MEAITNEGRLKETESLTFIFPSLFSSTDDAQPKHMEKNFVNTKVFKRRNAK